jgi:osmotically-inducible protein OsmY
VRNGVVTLRGRVTSIDEAEEAEGIASDVPGVLEVNEQLEIVT